MGYYLTQPGRRSERGSDLKPHHRLPTASKVIPNRNENRLTQWSVRTEGLLWVATLAEYTGIRVWFSSQSQDSHHFSHRHSRLVLDQSCVATTV